MKLKFLQSGGSFNPRYSVYEPYIVPEEEVSSSSAGSGKSKEGSSANSDILKMIKESFSNGLPSDLQEASATIANVFSNIEKMLENPDLYGGTGAIASAYAKALPLLKSIEFNSKQYEDIYKSLNDSGSMQEVAINSIGQLAVESAEGFSWITPEEYYENPGQYNPVSNARLLDARANSISFAFKNSVFETLKNGISIDTITKQILEYASKVGNQEEIQTGYGYVSGGNIMKDFQTFSKSVRLEGFDPKKDDLYSYEVATKTERENAYTMLDIIYNMLPQPSKTLLKYKSNGTDRGAKGMIAVLMTAATDHSVTTKINLEEGYSKSSKSSSDGDDKYFNHVIRAAMGLGSVEDFVINPGTSNFFTVKGTTIPIMNSSSEMIQKDLLSDVKSSEMGQMLLTTDISIAGQHVDSSAASKIYLTGRRVTLVDLPWTYERDSNGEYTNHIVPDYSLLEQKDQVEKHMRDNNWTFKDNFQEIQQYISDQKLTIKYNKQGQVQFPHVKRFAIFNANFPEDVFADKKIKNGKFLKPLLERDAVNTYNQIMQQNGWTNKDWDYDVEGWGKDPIYTGTVAIPVDTTFLNLVTKDLDAETTSILGDQDKLRREREQAQSNWNYV